MTLKEFAAMLEKHDWYYVYSDDHRYYKKGSESRRKINEAMESFRVQGLEQEAIELYNALCPDDFRI